MMNDYQIFIGIVFGILVLGLAVCLFIRWVQGNCVRHCKHNPKCLVCVKYYAKQNGYNFIYSKDTNTYHDFSKSDGSCNLDNLVKAEPKDKANELDYDLFKTEQEIKNEYKNPKFCKHCNDNT